MRYFIDTNIFLFLSLEQDELEQKVRTILDDYENEFIMSGESVREILMLIKNGRIKTKKLNSYTDIKFLLEEHRIDVRYMNESHLKAFGDLDQAPNHSDPADLMIIAQAISENVPIISSDAKFKFYTKQGLRLISNNR